jgi:hypothetical protein
VFQAKVRFKVLVLLIVPVLFISQNVMSDMRQMPAYLVGSPSEQLDFQQAISASGISSSAVEGLFGLCQIFVFALGLLEFARPLTSEGMVDQPFFF